MTSSDIEGTALLRALMKKSVSLMSLALKNKPSKLIMMTFKSYNTGTYGSECMPPVCPSLSILEAGGNGSAPRKHT